MKTIVLINRFPIVRIGLRTLLADLHEHILIMEESDINIFRKKNPDLKPNIVVLAISQEADSNNAEFLVNVKKSYPLAGVILYDQNPVQAEIPVYFKYGIHGYLTSAATVAELKECIHEVLIGKKFITSEVLALILEAIPLKKKEAVFEYPGLTRKENEIADYISQGVRTSVIAATLGKRISTISTVKRNVYKKLCVNNIIELHMALTLIKADIRVSSVLI